MGYPLFFLKEYLFYRKAAKNAHGLHSPFVYALFTLVIKKKDAIRSHHLLDLRKKITSDRRKLTYKDPKTNKQITTTVQSLAKTVASTHRFSMFLIHLIEWLGVHTVLETGSSIGLNALYLSQAKTLKRLVTIEGSEVLANVASGYLNSFSIKDTRVIKGNIYDVFEEQLVTEKPGLIFLDADHRKKSILYYLKTIRNLTTPPVCIAIHDIHWSPEMQEAWKEVIRDPDYPLTIDIFHSGLIFPSFQGEKQHFILKF